MLNFEKVAKNIPAEVVSANIPKFFCVYSEKAGGDNLLSGLLLSVPWRMS